MDRKPLLCTIRAPLSITVSNGSGEFHSGCSVVDVFFPKTASVDIDEIYFKNYYTTFLSVLVRSRSTDDKKPPGEWKVCVRAKRLMPHPHCEQSSEDYFTIKSSEVLADWHGISDLRFVLQQPSPMWKEFKIEEVQIFGLPPTVGKPGELDVPGWLTELSRQQHNEDQQLKGVTSVVELSKKLQQMWAMTEQTQRKQTNTTIGRYDADGSYDINVLSYT